MQILILIIFCLISFVFLFLTKKQYDKFEHEREMKEFHYALFIKQNNILEPILYFDFNIKDLETLNVLSKRLGEEIAYLIKCGIKEVEYERM